jgi:hypothetical protein
MQTYAPTLPTCTNDLALWSDALVWTGSEPPPSTCPAPAPATCEGTDWPPMTSMQRYAAERATGDRVPPSVSVWREQDRRRQAAAERAIREQGPSGEPRVVAWGPGPACEDRKAVA